MEMTSLVDMHRIALQGILGGTAYLSDSLHGTFRSIVSFAAQLVFYLSCYPWWCLCGLVSQDKETAKKEPLVT